MSLLSNKGIKRIIAREGLITVGLAIILYFLVSFFLENVPVALPRYSLEFTNGEIRSIDIFPEIRNGSNYRELLEETHSPSSKLIEKRIKEFIKVENIKSPLKSSRYVNSHQIYISRLYSNLIGATFILKLLVVYLVLLLIRFTFWALSILIKPSL